MKRVQLALLIVLILVLTACAIPFRKEAEREPVTLNVLYFFNKQVKLSQYKDIMQNLKEALPHVSFQFFNYHNMLMESTIEARQHGDEKMDIIIESLQRVVPFAVTEGVAIDLTPWIRTKNIDLDRFQPEFTDHIRAWSTTDEIYALPLYSRLHALFYNTEAMKVGAFPELHEGMTWDDIVAISEKHPILLTSNLDHLNPIESQHRLLHVDPVTNSAGIWTDEWKMALQLYRQLNFESTDPPALNYFPGAIDDVPYLAPIQWDMLSFPRIADHPDWGPNALGEVIMVHSESEHLEDAIDVVIQMVSDDFQLKSAQSGYPSTLKNPEMQAQFGADNPDFVGKNIEALFALPNTVLPSHISKYDHTSNWITSWTLYHGSRGFGLVRSGDDPIEQVLEQVEPDLDMEIKEIMLLDR